MKITVRFGHFNDPRIKKTPDGMYEAYGTPGVYRTWLLAFEAMSDRMNFATSKCETMPIALPKQQV